MYKNEPITNYFLYKLLKLIIERFIYFAGLINSMHFKVKNIKGHKYLYIIKNDRIDGKVVQTIQKYVGTADSLYEMLTSNVCV